MKNTDRQINTFIYYKLHSAVKTNTLSLLRDNRNKKKCILFISLHRYEYNSDFIQKYCTLLSLFSMLFQHLEFVVLAWQFMREKFSKDRIVLLQIFIIISNCSFV